MYLYVFLCVFQRNINGTENWQLWKMRIEDYSISLGCISRLCHLCVCMIRTKRNKEVAAAHWVGQSIWFLGEGVTWTKDFRRISAASAHISLCDFRWVLSDRRTSSSLTCLQHTIFLLINTPYSRSSSETPPHCMCSDSLNSLLIMIVNFFILCIRSLWQTPASSTSASPRNQRTLGDVPFKWSAC